MLAGTSTGHGREEMTTRRIASAVSLVAAGDTASQLTISSLKNPFVFRDIVLAKVDNKPP